MKSEPVSPLIRKDLSVDFPLSAGVPLQTHGFSDSPVFPTDSLPVSYHYPGYKVAVDVQLAANWDATWFSDYE